MAIKEDSENERIKNTNSDRKRAADDDDSLSSLPKRSRLDDVIGKLGSQIGIPLDKVRTMDELSDTDATDASHLDSEMTESKSEETSSDTHSLVCKALKTRIVILNNLLRDSPSFLW
jgi:hypothetical protein